MDTFDLRGRVVIVTGSTKGIGKAIAAGFCRAGAKVVVSSRKADACEAVTAELNREQARDGGEAVSIPCHAGKLDELEALVSRTLDRWGKITTCVPNAAANPTTEGSPGSPTRRSTRSWRPTCAPRSGCAGSCSRTWSSAGTGRSSSSRASRGSRGAPISGRTRCPRSRATSSLATSRWSTARTGSGSTRIAPGLIKTDFAKALWTDPERLDAVSRRLPLRRIGDPAEVAGAALFLASPAASYVTGQVLNVCGGAAVGMRRGSPAPPVPPAPAGPAAGAGARRGAER